MLILIIFLTLPTFLSFMTRLRSGTVSWYIIASKKQLPQPFNSWFVLFSDTNTHNKSGRFKVVLRFFLIETSANVSAIFTRNYLQNLYKNKLFHQLTKNGLIKYYQNHIYLEKYLIDFSLFNLSAIKRSSTKCFLHVLHTFKN